MNSDFKDQLKNLIENQIFENNFIIYLELEFDNEKIITCPLKELNLVGKKGNVLKYTRINEKYNYLVDPPTLITYFNLDKISSFTISIESK